jgi:hypothetical protein
MGIYYLDSLNAQKKTSFHLKIFNIISKIDTLRTIFKFNFFIIFKTKRNCNFLNNRYCYFNAYFIFVS